MHQVKKQIVILGGGFGGITAAKRLRKVHAQITLIDRNNYHLFIPLLYQVATAGLSPADIAVPIRRILRKQKNAKVIMSEVVGIDLEKKEVVAQKGRIGFDYLILSPGSAYNYFGHTDWEQWAPSLRGVPDATRLRKKILSAFETAEHEDDPERVKALLTFSIVGGGPTGVEIAGAIAELAKKVLHEEFRAINPGQATITLYEAGPRILAGFSEELSNKAVGALEKLGVQVEVQSKVEHITSGQLQVNGTKLASDTIIWAAGVKVPHLGDWLSAKTDGTGRIVVESDLSVPSYPHVFVIGDAACVTDKKGKPLPAIAPVAMQQARFVADVIQCRMTGSTKTFSFRYIDKGQLATVGRSSAIAQFGNIGLSGLLAWLLWAIVHIFYLIGFRNRTLVFLQWAWAYFTYERGARLIVSHSSSNSIPGRKSK